MKRIFTLLLMAVFLAVCSVTSSAAVLDVVVNSTCMDKPVKVKILLPDSYETSPNRRFPVMYLLHGAGGNQNDWIARSGAVKEYVNRYDFIVVCPDGKMSWYYDSPVDPKIKYETFCSQELIKWVDAKFRTIDDRRARAFCGLSMGGHGALWLAIRHKEKIGTGIALSGGVDVRKFPKNWNLPNLLGKYEENKEVWDKHMVITEAASLKNGELAIAIDCGVNDFFSQANRDLHELLLKNKVAHDYQERPGGHTWEYWNRVFPYASVFFRSQFRPVVVELMKQNMR